MNSNIFFKFIKNGEIYVDEINWCEIKNSYTQNFIIKQISDAIRDYNIELPYRKISKENVYDDYFQLVNLQKNLICDGKWVNKFQYKYPFIDKYIDISKVGNLASDYFHQKERWKCDVTGYLSPQKTWNVEKFRLSLFKALFSLNVKEINPTILRNIISLRKYIAAQFRPSVAKAIYDMFQAGTVLDFSMGWSDRILGAHTSKYVKKYVGFDPNINLFDGYNNQINYYNKINTLKIYIIKPNCAEDDTITLNDKFDLVFTSPPYFDKEKYN